MTGGKDAAKGAASFQPRWTSNRATEYWLM